MLAQEYRCVNCDTAKYIRWADVNYTEEDLLSLPSEKDLGVCEKCGGELRKDLEPMCPKCKSKDVEAKGEISLTD